MKIWGEIPKIFGVYDKQKSVGKVDKASGVAPKKDVLSISSEAKDFQTVMKGLKDVPDIRADKVKELSSRYDSGTYDVNGKDIADRVIKAIIDKKA
jgi:negative regulator of flagellin synthesis FlgM